MFRIHHKKGHNVYEELEEYPDVFYMKKWWIEHKFKGDNGEDLIFKGWINTNALSKEDFPETLEGTYWVESEYYNGGIGHNGHFDIGFGEKDNYVLGSVSYDIDSIDFSKYSDRQKAELFVKYLDKKIDFLYPRIDGKLENDIVLRKTYIDTVRL